METLDAHVYDFPQYYDLLFGSDWRAEYDFLRAVFDRHGKGKVRRLFEPACGTGRLLYRLGRTGCEVSGLDLNAKAVGYCNERLARYGLPESVFVGDMTDFRLPRKVDAAFNTINSFRHLLTEKQAEDHLRCMAECLRVGGIYVLGFHLTPTKGPITQEESWSARRGHLAVLSRMWTIEYDPKKRIERVKFDVDVYTPTKQFRIEEEFQFRTYTAAQFARLLGKVPALRLVAVHDFKYDTDCAVEIDAQTEDVVYILRKE